MSDSRSTDVHIEGTRFYRRSDVRNYLRVVLVGVVVIIVLLLLSFGITIDIGARQAYKEARDVRRALHGVGVEYYGRRSSVFDPNSMNGLAEGAAEEIAELSTRKGEVILYEWDESSKSPLKFEYRKGLFRVMYVDTGTMYGTAIGIEGDFSVYYSFEILKFEAE